MTTNAKKFAFGCLPWAIWQLQVQGTQSEIAFNFHILSIYYVQDCLRNFKRSKIMYINVENDPEIRFLENIEQFLFSQTTLDRIFDKNDNITGNSWESRVFTLKCVSVRSIPYIQVLSRFYKHIKAVYLGNREILFLKYYNGISSKLSGGCREVGWGLQGGGRG